MLEIFNFCVIIISNYDFTAALNNFFRFSLKNKLKFYLLRLSKRHYIIKFNKNTITVTNCLLIYFHLITEKEPV